MRPKTPPGSNGVVLPAPSASNGLPDFAARLGVSGSASTGLTRLGNLPSKFGSILWIRLSRGGCVANSWWLKLPNAQPKNIWLISSACAFLILEVSGRPPIFFSAPAIPSGSRVNCTAEASARYSRCLDTALLINLPKKSPIEPITIRPTPTARITKTNPPPLSFRELRPELPMERSTNSR